MHWRFFRSATDTSRETWIWVREDGYKTILASSAQTFDSYVACMQDAIVNGYGYRFTRTGPDLHDSRAS